MSTAHDQANQALAQAIHEHAVEVDTELARIWQTEDRYRQLAINEEGNRNRDNGRWFSQQRLDDYLGQVAEAKAEAKPYVEDYLASGCWSRFFLVLNTGGHIHRDMSCSTCFNTTRFAWLPSLSGLTEAEAVADQGEILCSVCFPSAPVAWTQGVSKATQAERDERAAAKAARAAKKAEKALYPEDPEQGWRSPDHGTLRTIAAAKSWLTDAMWWNEVLDRDGRIHPSFPLEAVEEVSRILGARLGTHEAEVQADARKRAAKR